MISVELRSKLAVSRGKLLSGKNGGTMVHAAAFLRDGRIILDRALLRQPRELRRIFTHELFHFVWWKLGNGRRLAWESILAGEMERSARGELGWSAEWRKKKLSPRDIQERTRAWRAYCCESFCDTGGFFLVRGKKHREFTLAAKFRTTRVRWLGDIISNEKDLAQFVYSHANTKMRRSGFDLPAVLSGLFQTAPSARAILGGPKKAEDGA